MHRQVPEAEKSRGTLALDLTGPHKAAEGGWRWAMVAVYRPLDAGNSLPYIRWLYTKNI
jgi:hypothetical protein